MFVPAMKILGSIAGALVCFLPGVARSQVTNPAPGLTMVRNGSTVMLVADLCAPGISVRATKYTERGATPQGWATRADVGAAAAVNGDFFDFPGLAWVIGRARGDGVDWPPNAQQHLPEVRSYWQFGPHLAALQEPSTVNPAPAPAVTEILGGHNTLIRDGVSRAPDFDGDAELTRVVPRTAIGLSLDHRHLYLFATKTGMNGTQ